MNKTNAIEDARDLEISDPQGKLRLVRLEGQDRTTPMTVKLVLLMLVKKISAPKRSKGDLQGVYEELEPGSTTVKEDGYTFVIK